MQDTFFLKKAINCHWKISFRNWVYNRFEDRSLLFITILENVTYDSFSSFHRILNIRLLRTKFKKSWHFRRCIQSSINWRTKIAEQVLRSHCKGQASIFKSIVDSITKKSFSMFAHTIIHIEYNVCTVYSIFGKENVFTYPLVIRCKNILE